MRTHILNIKLDEEVVKKLRLVCEQEERPMGWYINDLLKKHLNIKLSDQKLKEIPLVTPEQKQIKNPLLLVTHQDIPIKIPAPIVTPKELPIKKPISIPEIQKYLNEHENDNDVLGVLDNAVEMVKNLEKEEPKEPIYKSPDDVVLDPKLIKQVKDEYAKNGGGDAMVELSLKLTREKIFNKQQKKLEDQHPP